MTFDVTAYGAVGNGVANDTAAITSAIAALVDGSELYFPAGTYLIGASSPVINFFTISKKRIKVYGDGIGSSTIKIANGCAVYQAIFHNGWEQDVTGLEICDLTFDHNIDNNTITLEGILAYPEISVSIEDPETSVSIADPETGVYNWHMHNLEFINSSSCWHLLLEGINMTNIRIENITCSNVGDDRDNVEHDTSIIYTEASDVIIQNCDFTAASEHALAAETAIEIHGSDTLVQNCTITDFHHGLNVTGIARAGTSSGIRVTGNHLVNLYGGIWIWSMEHPRDPSPPTVGIDGLIIDNNDIDISCATDANERFGIAFYAGNTLAINDVNIHDNTISMSAIDSVASDERWYNLAIGSTTQAGGKASNIIIADNVVTNFQSNAIRFQYCAIEDVTVTGNTFIDCASALPASGSIAVSPILVHLCAVDTLTFSGNAFIDNIPVTRIHQWFYLIAQTSCTGLTLSGNTYSMTGDKAAFVLPIKIDENISQPLITETIADFVPPTHKVNPASTVTDGTATLIGGIATWSIHGTTWTVNDTGLTWTSTGESVDWNDAIDLPQITVTGLSTGNAVRLYDSAGTLIASAVEAVGTAVLEASNPSLANGDFDGTIKVFSDAGYVNVHGVFSAPDFRDGDVLAWTAPVVPPLVVQDPALTAHWEKPQMIRHTFVPAADSANEFRLKYTTTDTETEAKKYKPFEFFGFGILERERRVRA